MIQSEGREFSSHPGQSFSLSLCWPIFITRANAEMDVGKDGTALYPPMFNVFYIKQRPRLKRISCTSCTLFPQSFH